MAVAAIGTVIAGVTLIARPISAWEPAVTAPSLPSF